MRMRIYVGKNGLNFEVFKSDKEPTRESHGHLYTTVIGPFKTMRAALYLVKNDHVHGTVEDIERLAKDGLK